MSAFDLDADLFMRVRRAVGIEETRYYLWGVFVEPIEGGGAWLVATDGHMMLVGRDATAIAPRSAIIRLSMTEEAGSGTDECWECGSVIPADNRSFEGQRLRMELPEKPGFCLASFWGDRGVLLPAVAQELDGKFPSWRSVWGGKPAKPVKGEFGLDPEFLARLAGDLRLQLQPSEQGGPFVVTFAGYPHLAGLLMPCSVGQLGADLVADLMPKAETRQ